MTTEYLPREDCSGESPQVVKFRFSCQCKFSTATKVGEPLWPACGHPQNVLEICPIFTFTRCHFCSPQSPVETQLWGHLGVAPGFDVSAEATLGEKKKGVNPKRMDTLPAHPPHTLPNHDQDQ
jgi:hypothetical protein